MGSMRDEMVKVTAELEKQSPVVTPEVEKAKIETKKEETPKVETKAEPEKLAAKTAETVITKQEESDDPLPEGWAEERKESWKTLSPDLRKYLKDREKQRNDGLTSKMQETDKIRKQYEAYAPVASVFDPIKDQLALQGVSVEQYTRNLINAHMAITKDPKSALRQLAKSYGLDPAELAEIAENTNPELAERDKRIAALEARFQQQQQGSEQAVATQVKTAIQTFQEEKDASGNAKHPHFDKVRVVMGSLMSSGQAKDLQDAYDRAVMVDPEIRESIFAERVKAELAKKDAENAEKAKAAKAAGLNIKGSGGVDVKEEKPKSWGNALRQTARELSN